MISIVSDVQGVVFTRVVTYPLRGISTDYNSSGLEL